MLIRPLSDTHCEFSIYNLPELEQDADTVLVLAGDIGIANVRSTIEPFLDEVSERFRDVLYIPGNHEYYHDGSLLRVNEKLQNLCKKYLNVHYLNGKSMDIDGFRFIGATLWTDMRKADPMVMMTAQEGMNDYVKIRTGTVAEPYRRRATPIDMLRMNDEDRSFIEAELSLANALELKPIVFTHHAPLMESMPRWRKANLLDYAYYNTCGLEDVMLKYNPLLWIHGHSHYPADYMVGDTRVVSNPRGYSEDSNGFESSDFFSSLVIEF